MDGKKLDFFKNKLLKKQLSLMHMVQRTEGYSRENLTGWIDDSLRNLSADTIDLLQLHCPPTALYDHGEVFGLLDDFVRAKLKDALTAGGTEVSS